MSYPPLHDPMQHARLPCPSPSPRVCPSSCPSNLWCHPSISFLLLPPSPPAFNLLQHKGLFHWVGYSHQVAKVLELQLQHQSFQWVFRVDLLKIDWLDLLAGQGTLKSLLRHQIWKASVLYGPTLTSLHDYCKNHSFDYMDPAFLSKSPSAGQNLFSVLMVVLCVVVVVSIHNQYLKKNFWLQKKSLTILWILLPCG